MNNVNNQQFAFPFNRQPLTLQFDTGNNIVIKQGTTVIGVKQSAHKSGKFSLYRIIRTHLIPRLQLNLTF